MKPRSAHASSTVVIPPHGEVPGHVAIIMDGNGRWAKRQHLPRIAGHRRGVEAVRATVKACAERGVGFLTLFAFSSENWRRPAEEVALLMQLFIAALENEVQKLHRNGIRLRVVGDTSRFDPKIQALIVAANYGGRWDILQALSRLAREDPAAAARGVAEEQLAPYLSMSYAPEP